MNKYLILGSCIAIVVIFIMIYNEGKKSGINKAENQCKAEIIIQTKEVIKVQNETQKTVIKTKKIAEVNRNIDRDKLIDDKL